MADSKVPMYVQLVPLPQLDTMIFMELKSKSVSKLSKIVLQIHALTGPLRDGICPSHNSQYFAPYNIV